MINLSLLAAYFKVQGIVEENVARCNYAATSGREGESSFDLNDEKLTRQPPKINKK